MKIGIIGAGSIGLLFASYLSRAFSVTLYTRTSEQAEEINKNALLLQKETNNMRAEVLALPITEWTGMEDLTIITVKQYQLHSIITYIHKLAHIPQNLLFVQNGMGHLKYLDSIKTSNIFVGSVEHGAQKVNAFTVRHNGTGVINVGVFKGDSATLHEFSAVSPSDFPITIHDDYYEILLNKLLINAVINPLTAILQVKNGELVNNLYYFTSLRNLFTEISVILNLSDPDGQLNNIINICKNTAENRSSMLKDLESKRETEVDAILGFLIDEANKQGKKAPLIEGYYYMLKGKEMDWRGCS